MQYENKESTLRRIVIEIKKIDLEKQNFILGYLEALKDINALSAEEIISNDKQHGRIWKWKNNTYYYSTIK